MDSKKYVLITGGSKGIGYGIAEVLLKAGYHVIITGRNAADLNEAVAQLGTIAPGKITGFENDVRDYDAQVDLVAKIRERYGSLDVVIANAGVGHFADIENLEVEQWKETIDINLSGVFYTLKASLDLLKASKGYFITIASLAGTNFFEKGSAYNASKFGLVGFTQAAMLDLRKHGIKTTTIMPGSVTSYFNGHVPSPEDSWKIQPEDIGQVIRDLLNLPERALPSKIEIRPSFPQK
jgi:3-oxoacyl-[acyl-carrier protein] reductase